MSDSEDSDLEEGQDPIRHRTKIVQYPYIHMEPPDVRYEKWAKIKPEVKKEAGHMMHVAVFWWHILLRQQDPHHPTTVWATDMGFMDTNVSNDLSLKRLQRIELLESILEAMERGLSHREMQRRARAVVSINMSFTMEEDCLADAVRWLEGSGVAGIGRRVCDLGSREVRYGTLRFIFSEYVGYLQLMSCSKRKAMEELKIQPDFWSSLKSEEMKSKGNEQFQKKKYDLAVKWYTKAIKYHPNNHILYGNRALCFIRSEKYLKALGDGKRAVILQPDWAKGHYRFCEALFCLGERVKALESNRRAQSSCSSDLEGHKDLLQQCERFQTELQHSTAEVKPKKMEVKRVWCKVRAHEVTDSSSEQQPDHQPHSSSQERSKTENREDLHEQAGNVRLQTHTEETAEGLKDMRSEMTSRKSKKILSGGAVTPAARSAPAQEEGAVGVQQCFSSAVDEARVCLDDQHYRNAQQSFTLALRLLDSSSITEMGLTELDRSLLVYGSATALLEIGQPEELTEAQRLFTKLQSSERTFQLLVHYGMGRVYLKENRFSKALEQFTNALMMIQRQITPGKLTWPTTKATVQETQPSYLKDQLINLVEVCKFPPKPDAVCRHQHCLSHHFEIYFNDPDFKGFIQLTCCQNCKVEFHIGCWKKMKTVSFMDKNDKDFLKASCFTPDCEGRICQIVIFGSTGLIKCEFKTSIPKIRRSGMRLKQPRSSIKKIKSKNDRKLRRKQQKLAVCAEHQENNEIMSVDSTNDQRAERASPSIYMDRVLHQIHENKELFKEETLNISCVLDQLRPWLDLYEKKGHESVLKNEPVLLSELVDLLLESRNRVWARVFIEILSSSDHIKPKLHHWTQRLDRAGLTAAETFISRYSHHLEQMDLSSLLTCSPLQHALIQSFGAGPELFDSGAFTVVEYLKQAPAREKRLFIWTLEENRECYESCHSILHQYFEDDAVCLVIRKADDVSHIDSVFKSKNRHRRKKQKESKPVIVLSGMRGLVSGAEDDEDDDDDMFADEGSLFFLSGSDPFSVPDHLRSQLAEFEEQYVQHRSHYERVLDNNPDPTKESLYDYFAQILEEHGPLCASDPLMVGELENFPPEAQQKISTGGGLKAFLLESLRFVILDDRIGLMKHAVSLTDSPDPLLDNSSPSSHLNPTAREFRPQAVLSYGAGPLFNNGSALKPPSSPDLLPESISDYYEFDSYVDASARADALLLYQTVGEHLTEHQLGPFKCTLNPPASAGDTHAIKVTKTHAGVSVRGFDDGKDVCINTEPFVSFERNNGDLLLKEKQNLQLQQKLQQMRRENELVQQKRNTKISVLETEIEKITELTEIATVELNLFQQKLEEEVKRDQQEKRENQETLKTLKGRIKDLMDAHETYRKEIREKSQRYQTELDQFLDISNQNAAEKMSLEDEIKRCRDVCVKADRRSLAAQLSVLQSRREACLRRLRMRVSEGKVVVKRVMELSGSFPALLSALEEWRRYVTDAEDKITRAEVEFEKQIEEVRKGIRLCSLPEISTPNSSTTPAIPVIFPASVFPTSAAHQFGSHYASLHGPYGSQQPSRTPTPQPAETSPPPAGPDESASRAAPVHLPAAQKHLTVYERILDRLNIMFPHYSRPVLSKFIQEVRSANGGALNTLAYDDVINRVAQLILDHQENMRVRERMTVTGGEMRAHGSIPPPSRTPPLTHVWKNVSEKHCNAALALNMEDPCIICHEDMSPEDLCVLECRHSFHRECIKSWLKEQSTCPTCREHALLPEDFPLLPGRHRKNTSAATSN